MMSMRRQRLQANGQADQSAVSCVPHLIKVLYESETSTKPSDLVYTAIRPVQALEQSRGAPSRRELYVPCAPP